MDSTAALASVWRTASSWIWLPCRIDEPTTVGERCEEDRQDGDRHERLDESEATLRAKSVGDAHHGSGGRQVEDVMLIVAVVVAAAALTLVPVLLLRLVVPVQPVTYALTV